ncbi:MAG: ATP-binding cassette domain-containing protein, partial [Candidatus Heimdallarchaeaceae archaeon]
MYKGKVETVAIPGISLTIREGERVAVRGKSGVGKTTLLHILSGILRPTSGKVIVNNRNILDMNEDE